MPRSVVSFVYSFVTCKCKASDDGSNDVLGSGNMGSGINDDLGYGNDCIELNNVYSPRGVWTDCPERRKWEERTLVWYVFFDLMLATYGLLYRRAGTIYSSYAVQASLDGPRFKKVHTFVAIDFALLTLGVSRVVFFSLDPWGQNNYFTCHGCVVVSRLISGTGIPKPKLLATHYCSSHFGVLPQSNLANFGSKSFKY